MGHFLFRLLPFPAVFPVPIDGILGFVVDFDPRALNENAVEVGEDGDAGCLIGDCRRCSPSGSVYASKVKHDGLGTKDKHIGEPSNSLGPLNGPRLQAYVFKSAFFCWSEVLILMLSVQYLTSPSLISAG